MTDYSAIFPSPGPPGGEGGIQEEGVPFNIPDLWRPSLFAQDFSIESTLFPVAPLQGKFGPPEISKPLPSYKDESEINLFTFSSGFARPTIDAAPVSPTSENSINPSDEGGVSADSSATSEDIWLQPASSEPPPKPRFQTWDSFLVPRANSPANSYLSESGSRVFDAVLAEYVEGYDEVGEVIRSDVFCTVSEGARYCLHMIERRANFALFDNVCGYPDAQRELWTVSVVASFAGCGKKIKQLQKFVSGIYKDASAFKPSVVALAECTTAIIESIQQRLSVDPTTIRSILHLHSLMREPSLIIETFHQIISQTSGISDDSELLSKLFEVVQQEQHRSGWLKPLLMVTLARATRPWLGFIEEWIGLDRPVGGEGIGFERLAERGVFVRIEEEMDVDERGAAKIRRHFIFDKKRVPSFMSSESAESVFESGKSLRFLEKFHPNHPLSKPGAVDGVTAPKLEWKFSWEDLNNLQNQAKNYEKSLQSAIDKYTAQGFATATTALTHNTTNYFEKFETFGKSKDEIGAMLGESLSAMSSALPPLEELHHDDLLRTLVLKISRLEQNPDSEPDHLTTFAPPISITPVLSFSHILFVQSQLINTACLRMFFKEHQVRSHLSLLRRFQLFGDGVFSSRLSHALFDDEFDATERHIGSHRSGGNMGLKLGSRDTWPPASSELRLALMGVLSESFDNMKGGIHHAGKCGELPGGLSFGVRDMSMEELEKCMDPNGIEALDFLRLQYKPPSPLEAIITPTTLYHYDRLFKLLLRVLRMLFVVNKLFRDATSRSSYWQGVDPTAQKFRIEAHHFVSTVCGYMFEIGVGSSWRKFEDKLQDIERKLDSPGSDLGGEGIERLRGYHESILDRIMFATLCRKRQAQVMKLMEDIFTSVLTFAKYSHARASGLRREQDTELAEMYKGFRRRVGIFISVCRGLSEKRGYADGRKDLEGRRAVDAIFGTGYKEEGNLLGMLLLRLEMTGYYLDTEKARGVKRKIAGAGEPGDLG